MYDLLKNWIAEGVAFEVNDFNLHLNLISMLMYGILEINVFAFFHNSERPILNSSKTFAIKVLLSVGYTKMVKFGIFVLDLTSFGILEQPNGVTSVPDASLMSLYSPAFCFVFVSPSGLLFCFRFALVNVGASWSSNSQPQIQ